MADQRPGLAARPMQRAVKALTRRILPGEAGQAAELALGAKVAIAAAPVLLAVLVILTTIVALVGVIGGESKAAENGGCGGGTVAPVELNGPPKNLIPIYQEASTAVGLNPEGPAMLAGINRVETDFGQDLGTSSAGAIGWMQFEPATWEEYGEGGDPYNAHDAIFAAARLLKANGAPGNWYQAIFTYNHADWYVEEVEKYAHEYAAEVPADPSAEGKDAPETETAESETETAEASTPKKEKEEESAEALETESEGPESEAAEASTPNAESETVSACGQGTGGVPTVPGEDAEILSNGLASAPAGAPLQVKEMIAAGDQIAMLPYVWGGHHALGSPTNGYDCSSAVSYLLYAAGLLPAGTAGFKEGDFFTDYVASELVPGGPVSALLPGPGQWVTIYANSEHTFMTIAGVRFDDSGSETRNGKGKNGANVSMWQPLETFPGFTVSHPATL